MRLARFASVGLSNTFVDFVAFNVLVFALGVPVIPANVLSNSLGVLNSYIWNRRWTFGDRASPAIANEMVKFVIIAVGAVLVNTAAVVLGKTVYALATDTTAATGYLALNVIKVLAIAVSLAWKYTLLDRWVFRARESESVEA